MMRRQLMRLINPMMKWLLRSPLHGMVSNHYLLITLIGRRSGKHYVTPVQYTQDAQTLTVVTSATYAWWKNLRGGADVTLLLRGESVPGQAQTYEDLETVVSAFQRLYARVTPAQVAQMTKDLIAIKITVPGCKAV